MKNMYMHFKIEGVNEDKIYEFRNFKELKKFRKNYPNLMGRTAKLLEFEHPLPLDYINKLENRTFENWYKLMKEYHKYIKLFVKLEDPNYLPYLLELVGKSIELQFIYFNNKKDYIEKSKLGIKPKRLAIFNVARITSLEEVIKHFYFVTDLNPYRKELFNLHSEIKNKGDLLGEIYNIYPDMTIELEPYLDCEVEYIPVNTSNYKYIEKRLLFGIPHFWTNLGLVIQNGNYSDYYIEYILDKQKGNK